MEKDGWSLMDNFTVETKVNDAAIRAELENGLAKACEMIGLAAVRFAATLCPVDTGRLRNSITYVTKTTYGQHAYTDNNGKGYTETLSVSADDNEVYFGTNVEYAVYQEARKHFIRKAADGHVSTYRSILQKCLDGLNK